jgi:endonuclease III
MNPPTNLDQVFETFEKNYKPIPLETYKSDPYKTLIATLLSARTKDTLTVKVCEEKLFKKAPDIESLSKLSTKELEDLIYPVGFYKVKSGHIKKLAEIIISKHKGLVPNTREELMELPGVGRKTANLVLNRAFDMPAIAVDTHVHRICNILGWVTTKDPLKTEVSLLEILPKNYWSKVNRLFVSIGQQFRSKQQLTRFLKDNGLFK